MSTNLVTPQYLEVVKTDTKFIADQAEKYLKSADPNINRIDRLIDELNEAFDLYRSSYNQMVRNHHTEVLKLEEYENFTQTETLFKIFISDHLATLYSTQKTLSDALIISKSPSKPAPSTPKIKYPEINLVKFSGEKTKWDTWWQGFNSMVHSKVELDAITKFTYLLTTLEGEAKRCVERFEVTLKGYDLAIAALTDKFSDPDASKRILIRKLLDIKSPSVTRLELENFKEDYLSFSYQLELLKIDITSCTWLIQEHLLRRLPQPVTFFICDKANTLYPTVQQILDNITLYIKRHNLSDKQNVQKDQHQAPRTRAEGNSTPSQKPSPQWSAKPAKKVSKSFNIASSSAQKTFNCIYCSQEHASRTCPQYPDRKGRITRLKALSRCTRCCQKHESTTCNVKLSACYKCAGDHHTWLCTEGKTQKPLVASVNADPS